MKVKNVYNDSKIFCRHDPSDGSPFGTGTGPTVLAVGGLANRSLIGGILDSWEENFIIDFPQGLMESMNNNIPTNADSGDESPSEDISIATIGNTSKCKSRIWDEFVTYKDENGKDRAKCKKCPKSFAIGSNSHGTSNLKKHVETVGIFIGRSHKDANQMHIGYDASLRGKRISQETYREKVTISIMKHNYPFSMVEHEGTRDLHIYLNQDVKPYCRNTAKSDCLKIYKGEKEKLMVALGKVSSRICLTSDIANVAIKKIRESVKYVKGSEGRIIKFAECCEQVGVRHSMGLRMDVPTRWNATFLMLESAIKYRLAFQRYAMIEPGYNYCPSINEWKKGEEICKMLKPFYDITMLLSGSDYPTANLYFQYVWKIQIRLLEENESEDVVISSMSDEMIPKFEKYWESYSVVLAMADVLDPRYKLNIVEFCYKKINDNTYKENVACVLAALNLLFQEYVSQFSVDTSNHASAMTSGDVYIDDDFSVSYIFFNILIVFNFLRSISNIVDV
ncbi:zinc finger BED domain-containing protein RICESLEEPER 2-like [Tasmannia lanceolata]|uniref:zinc finger BED domain-containing protein RICESLEEPER 2-like n=1 Tax=Tasmannia lanceolata TaxID=3420 RepID=UPI004063DC72